ncbi:rhodanese domain-containing protein [Clostridium sporogenes]|uniref:Putative 3-mercaptopyruvate sulfurtransferase SseA n=1 Tax=Clostridium sporogenes TaxID=1509 RepID=A0A7U5D272_CLOSG|nr:sulfurtransferase [Clostridium sporogenes]AVP61770.1 sulfurtransferase [Clostridium botulinum]AKC61531.1 putative 3-mercaptopyruvate sulfurtransferase SseA [Clostridium sporogenes]AKJ88860.1 sulfurtransferase [Clostridium sporogenes]KCZ68836.1 putative 3-mercaptopyruvate sulfurtransferase SseA [Clostridium sporogenes]OOO68147.1 sulfurtransferase [Clostridium sporogenes]
MKNFVSTKWLQNHLEDENIVILDCRGDLLKDSYGEEVYRKGHIKNAVFADLKKVMSSEEREHGGRNPLPNVDDFKRSIEKLGINKNTLVVAYDELKIAGAARFCWMLRYVGHTDNYVLDGGINKWIAENRKLYIEANNSKEKLDIKNENFNISLNEEIKADVNYIKDNMKKDLILVDSRTNIRYEGIEEPIDKRAGHIPGAKNIYWKDMLKEDGAVDEDKVRENFLPLKDYTNIAVYCGSGIDATFNFLLLDEVGIKARVYAGSWSDWITYEENPIDTK